MYPWYRESVAAVAAGLGGPVGVVGSGFCSGAPGQGGTTIKTESGYSDCMLALDYVQSKVKTSYTRTRQFLIHIRYTHTTFLSPFFPLPQKTKSDTRRSFMFYTAAGRNKKERKTEKKNHWVFVIN